MLARCARLLPFSSHSCLVPSFLLPPQLWDVLRLLPGQDAELGAAVRRVEAEMATYTDEHLAALRYVGADVFTWLDGWGVAWDTSKQPWGDAWVSS